VDREAAAARILNSHPNLSDRAVADIAGLAARTVATLRVRVIPEGGHVTARVGKDGRIRPLNTADARRVASEMLSRHPESSLREVARVAGLSPGTVRNVRERLRRGDTPVPGRQEFPGHPPVRPEAELLRGVASGPAAMDNDGPPATVRNLAVLLGHLN